MTQRAVIVHRNTARKDWLGRGFMAAVVLGTPERYYPAAYDIFRWTASGAKRAGERKIRRMERKEARAAHRDRMAYLATRGQR